MPDNPLVNVNLRSITVDCADPERVAIFWAAALGWSVKGIDHDGAVVGSDLPDMPRLLFLAVPEAKEVKNRWHLGLQAATTMDAEVPGWSAWAPRPCTGSITPIKTSLQ